MPALEGALGAAAAENGGSDAHGIVAEGDARVVALYRGAGGEDSAAQKQHRHALAYRGDVADAEALDAFVRDVLVTGSQPGKLFKRAIRLTVRTDGQPRRSRGSGRSEGADRAPMGPQAATPAPQPETPRADVGAGGAAQAGEAAQAAEVEEMARSARQHRAAEDSEEVNAPAEEDVWGGEEEEEEEVLDLDSL